MPIREIIEEAILRPIIVGISYVTGYVILKSCTLGAIKLAPLSTIYQKNRGKKWYQVDWSMWLERGGRGRMLKAVLVCTIGFIAWGAVGLTFYMVQRDKDEAGKPAIIDAASMSR
ncbi:MAG: hypothetical protein RLZZ505_1342 [Verrucomicrobiota bacterium]|jgi:hypothetical protein